MKSFKNMNIPAISKTNLQKILCNISNWKFILRSLIQQSILRNVVPWLRQEARLVYGAGDLASLKAAFIGIKQTFIWSLPK